MGLSEGSTVICYNNADMKDILTMGKEYQIEKIIDDDLMKLIDVSELVFIWRFINPDTQ
ncbi:MULTISPECIES: hypothetical protein [Klebsiella]|uniref:hypothetical protein n=1 Tax=Klebsiella TaxID=570 RepID=UPI0009CAFB7F|nr:MULTISPECIES: hypothetical protein [Klebsiella]HDH1551925.1 hypothetical protein [Klebsiella quasipneumoniae subsp. quasipneumoniae]MCB3856738.1 hypothetical protein [Klebsiella quasipneumoniae]SLN98365.1 Uncharacterised protein [Klebsiella pneumoniae]SLO19875.1 Uncharacterised protein [Klebsiella pneumoniae]SLO25960.1 Uncharacterised protein [Klebsiella pneumoniae]